MSTLSQLGAVVVLPLVNPPPPPLTFSPKFDLEKEPGIATGLRRELLTRAQMSLTAV